MQDRLEDVLAICTRVLFYKNGFTIAKFKLAESGKEVSFKGNYYAIQDVKYYISGKDSQDPKYPDTYWADVVRRDIDFSNMDKQGVSDYLHSIVAESIADAMIEQLDDPIKVLNDGDVEALTEVKGVGEFRANSILETHMNQIDISPLITALKPFKLTNKAIYKVLEHYNNSIDLAIKEVKDNPYKLSDVPGFGFMKADSAFLSSENYSQSAMKDKRRIEAYVKYLFEEEFLNGNTWINGMQLQEKVKKYIGEVDWGDLMNHINTSDEYMIIKGRNGSNRITTKENASLEYDTANMLVERVQSENNFKILNIDSTIEKVEKRQGFDFNDDQKDAMRLVFDSNISLIQGLAGSGKTTMMNGIINTYRDNGYSVISTALSGKASDNIMRATSNQAKTLHSLLMYGTPQQFNLQKPLEYDIIVLEELSMVDLRIFNALLKAMKPKSKLIMLGDSKQLESISVGVMNSIIYSNIIPSFTLTKIQRQAQGSAIITHSVPIREGYLNEDVTVKSNTNKRYGEYQDLEYVFLNNNAEESMYKYTLKRFKDSIEMYGIENTQILSATKNSGKNSTYHLNTVAQMIANPSNKNLKEFKITFGKDNEHYILREGDRIINTKNDRTITDVDGNSMPIYNGNTGKLLRIEDDGKDAFLIIEMDGIGTVSVPVNEKDNKIQLGYAITIHKSQGSTIKSVIVSLPFHYMLNSRQLLYTAITRASDYCCLITTPKTITSTLKKDASKTEQVNLGYFIDMIYNKEGDLENGK